MKTNFNDEVIGEYLNHLSKVYDFNKRSNDDNKPSMYYPDNDLVGKLMSET